MTVQASIDDLNAAATDALIGANTFLNGFLNIATASINRGDNLSNTLPSTYDPGTEPDANFVVVSGGTRPNVTDIPLGAAPTAPVVAFSSLVEITMPVDDLLAPTNNFTFFEQAYSSTLLDAGKAKLLNDLVNGGYGIDTLDEAALYQRARDRETDGALIRIDEAGRSMAARGFPLPPGELSIVIDRGYQDLQGKLSSVSREIFIDSAKRFVENRQFTIQEVRQLETVLLGFHNSVQERAFNVAKATQELAIVVYNALLARYRTRLDAAKITSDVQLARAQIDVERARASLDIFRGQIAAYEANLRFLLEPLKMQVDLYRADIDANRALMDGVISRATLQQKMHESTAQENIQKHNLLIDAVKAKLLAQFSGLQISAEAMKFGAKEFFTTLATLYASLNTLSVQSAEE